MRSIEEKRYFLKYELEYAITEIIRRRGALFGQETAKELFDAWCEDEDGDLALNRLINLIIY